MYSNSAYLKNSRIPYKDKSKPLIVTCCGTYRLFHKEKLPTWRPKGSNDYQLLYVVAGKTTFYINKKPHEVTAGQMVLFHPYQEQHYEYFGKDKPEVFWVHFTGSNVKNILKSYNIPMDKNIFNCGTYATYSYIFKEMIDELQNRRTGFQELLEMYLRQIFILIQRNEEKENTQVSSYLLDEIEYARKFFTEHYNEDINISEYAQSRGMSVSWFLRNFKHITKKSPMQYILNIRINNAVSLLETTDYNVTEIAAIIGYDNPLYFSRIFHKQKGISPSEYRKRAKTR